MSVTVTVSYPCAPEALPVPEAPPPVRPGASELLSPFVPWEAEERAPLPAELLEDGAPKGLLVALLRDPADVVARLLDPAQVQRLVLGALGAVAGGVGLFSLVGASARHIGGSLEHARLAALAVGSVLAAVAAALGPIYAASLVLAARLPLARLVATLLSAAGTGALLLAGLAPPFYLAWRLDDVWAGPLVVLGSFALAGVAAGVRTHQLLFGLAEAVVRASLRSPTAALSPGDAFRVGILARVALMVLLFTMSLAFWAFDAFG